MSQGGRAGDVTYLAGLRAAIARIEAGGAALGAGPRGRVALGAHATQLDAVLGGGLARGALHEVVPAGAPDRAAATGFTLTLALRFAAAAPLGRRALVWITEDFAAAESGALYGPGLAAFGLDPARLILVHAPQGQQALWAMEEALKCRALAAVVGELWDARACDLTASRRLALAARASGVPGLLLQARAPPASAGATRFAVAAASGLPSPLWEGVGGCATLAGARRPPPLSLASSARPRKGEGEPRGKPLPGPPAFDVRLLRARGALQLDPDRCFSLTFDPTEGFLRDRDPAPQPHAGAVPAHPGDRPHPPPAGHLHQRRA